MTGGGRTAGAVLLLHHGHEAKNGPGQHPVILAAVDCRRRPVEGDETSNVAGPTSTSTSRSPSQTLSPARRTSNSPRSALPDRSPARAGSLPPGHGEPRRVSLPKFRDRPAGVHQPSLCLIAISLTPLPEFGHTDVDASDDGERALSKHACGCL